MYLLFMHGSGGVEFRNWVKENPDTFALARILGYEIEKEKQQGKNE